jgi:hypothetical protein
VIAVLPQAPICCDMVSSVDGLAGALQLVVGAAAASRCVGDADEQENQPPDIALA